MKEHQLNDSDYNNEPLFTTDVLFISLDMEFIQNLSKLIDKFLQGGHHQKSDEVLTLAAFNSEDEQREEHYYRKVITSTELLLRIFQNKYDSNLNIFIENIFQQIQNLLDFYIKKNCLVHFPINELLNIIYLIFDITVSNPTDENISKLNDFYNFNLSEIELKTSKEYVNLLLFTEELSLRIRIISFIYDAVHNVANRKPFSDHTTDSIDLFMSRLKKSNIREFKTFFLLVICNCDVLAAQTLLNVIPKYVKFSKNNEILHYIWKELSESLSLENNVIEHSKIILILCCLSDLYFIDNQNNLIENIFNDKNYWILLQQGLINVAYSVRKQTLYLLKKSVKCLMTNHLIFKCFQSKNLSRNYPLILGEHYSILKYNREFEEIFIILEYIEEKQIHLVKPIFKNIQNFITYYLQEGSLHVSWIIVIFQRMLVHDNIEVVKWGISTLLKIPVEEFCDEEIITKVIHLLISSLNCTQLYFSDFEVLLDELKHYFKTCLEANNGHLFFKILIKEICCIRWSSEALFFVINAISFVHKKNVWGKPEIELIKKLITSGIANHYTYIKSGMLHQLLLLSINLINLEELSLKDIFCFLIYFCKKGCLKKEAKIWNTVTYWIRNSFAKKDVKNFIVELINNVPWNVKESNTGKIIVLLNDAYNDTFSLELSNLVKTFLISFIDIHARPYCNSQTQDHYLSIVHDVILQESDESELFNIIKLFVPNIVTYIELQLNSVYHIRDFDSCHFYMKVLRNILQSDIILTPELISIIDKWLEKIVKNFEIQISSDCYFPIQKFIQIKTLNLILDCNLGKDLSLIIEDLRLYLKTNLNSALVKTSHEMDITNDLQTLWGRMNSEYLAEKWWLFSKIVDSVSPQEFLNMDNSAFLQLCFKILDIVGGKVLLPLMDILNKTFPRLTNEPDFELMISHLWFTIMERKKNDDYYHLIKSFIDLTFRLDLKIKLNGADEKQLPCYRLMSGDSVNEANLLMKKLQTIKYEENFKNFFSDFLSCALLYGELLGKNEKLIGYISSFIDNMNLSSLKNDRSTSNEVRARAIQIVLNFNPGNECHCQFVSQLIDKLIKTEKNFNKNRYFADSHVHRINQRLMQSLLILQLYTTKEQSEKLFSWLMNKIIIENHQPSVRYLQEWLIMRILYKNPCLRDTIWSYFDEGVIKRFGSLCSLISIIYHIVKFIPLDSKAFWMDNAVRKFLPCCMAQHFSVRLYAQVALQKLMALAETLNLTVINEKYRIIAESLTQSIHNGKTHKNFVKLDEDFYFSVFDPVDHYSLETIFFDIPRLMNVSADEWITDSLLLNCGVEASGHIPLRSENKALKSILSSTWMLGGVKQNYAEDVQHVNFDISLENLQKKMIPAKSLIPDSFLNFCDDQEKKYVENGLIVVASLIDRIPNLGGLSRTCEIFGVSKLVIGSLHFVEDKQFQSLSVTAEKWISISEVKPHNLSEFLIKMKQNGYVILAAEQTLDSTPLNKIKFPKNSLILLGNEKEGIPTNLLPLMDICIEIPQMGNIRSLNVHVTGALFIWEYAKQHHFSLEST